MDLGRDTLACTYALMHNTRLSTRLEVELVVFGAYLHKECLKIMFRK